MASNPEALATLASEQLHKTSTRTVGHYNGRAEAFWQGTRDHDVSQNIEALLRHLPEQGQHAILDFGCGPGRDLTTFRDLGHRPTGLDGSENFVSMARAHSGCPVLHQDFLQLELPEKSFDGIFANATLFHIPSQEFPRVLQELKLSLRDGGVLFSSNPRGANQEGWSDQRYNCYFDLKRYRQYLQSAGFDELEHYYRPKGLPQEQQPWLASVWRKR